MLVLSRKADEVIVIGGQIVVAVLRIEGNQVRLGIQAPRQVPIYRGEIEPPAIPVTVPQAGGAATEAVAS
jgi:carbon storage regulator